MVSLGGKTNVRVHHETGRYKSSTVCSPSTGGSREMKFWACFFLKSDTALHFLTVHRVKRWNGRYGCRLLSQVYSCRMFEIGGEQGGSPATDNCFKENRFKVKKNVEYPLQKGRLLSTTDAIYRFRKTLILLLEGTNERKRESGPTGTKAAATKMERRTMI